MLPSLPPPLPSAPGPYTSFDLNTLFQATSGSRQDVQLSLADDLSGEASRIAGTHGAARVTADSFGCRPAAAALPRLLPCLCCCCPAPQSRADVRSLG